MYKYKKKKLAVKPSNTRPLAHIREVLQDDPGGMEGDLNLLVLVHPPIQNVLNVLLGHLEPITVSHCRLQQHTNGIRQLV